MRKKREKQRYRTHPAVKALLSLSLLLTTAAVAASWGFYRYVHEKEKKADELYERCAYEAYVSLCENLVRGESAAAADALSRLGLYADCGEAEALREAILSGRVNADLIDAITLSGSGDASERIAAAVKRADGRAAGMRRAGHNADTGADGVAAGWETLSDMAEVGKDEAREIAESALGGGAALSDAENHGFPPVYTFTCKNAAADVTRAGGRLLRLYAYRHGTAEVKGADECREAAEAFVRRAGIYDAAVVSAEAGEDGYDFVLCPQHSAGGEKVTCVDEEIKVGIAAAGGGVRFFDATAYYGNRPRSYDGESVHVGRKKAASLIGVDGGELTLIRTGGELFWRFSGVKILLIDVKNGEIRVQNP